MLINDLSNRNQPLFNVLIVVLAASCSVVNAQDNCPDDTCLCGDANVDGIVDLTDAGAWCEVISNSGGPYICGADGNYDGVVDLLDLVPYRNILLEYQNESFLDSVLSGPADFFWSTIPLESGAVNENLDLSLEVGQSSVLYLYYTPSGPTNSDIDDGFSINVATSNDGVIQFDDAGIFNFSISFMNIVQIGNRWDYPANNSFDEPLVQSAATIQSDLIVGMTAISLCNGSGILRENINDVDSPFVDDGYDFTADAFLVGKIELTAVGPGEIELIAGPNDLGISHNQQLIDAVFAKATISVPSDVLLGDVNLDGEVNLLDVSDFVDRISTGVFQAEADVNQDEQVNLLDVSPFVDLLASN